MEADADRPSSLAVVVVTFENEREIGDCLRAVEEQLPPDGIVVVVDNDSHDATADLVAREFPDARLIRSASNDGFARACNRAAAAVDAELLLFLNPDTVVQPGCLDAIVELAHRRRGGGLYGGRALDGDGRFDPRSCWGRPTMWSLVCFATGLSSVFARSERLNPEGIGGWRRDEEREVDVISGCLLLVRRDVWDCLGGFDERFFMYGEDADLAVRAHQIGCRPVITPRAVVRHEVGASSHAVDKNLMLYRGKATLVGTLWSGPSRRVALALLEAGVGLRAALARVAQPRLGGPRVAQRTGADVWGELWRRRSEWVGGWGEEERG